MSSENKTIPNNALPKKNRGSYPYTKDVNSYKLPAGKEVKTSDGGLYVNAGEYMFKQPKNKKNAENDTDTISAVPRPRRRCNIL